MGRFFPHADLPSIIRNMKTPDAASYNTTFTYPQGGAIEYVKALASAVRPEAIALEEPLMAVDLERRVARTPKREIQFQRLVSSAPLNRLLHICALPHDASLFSWNRVQIFNLGFDRKGPPEPHWIYYPDRERVFYRVGFYDNIIESDRMSLYVEIGFPRTGSIDVTALRQKVLEDLAREGVITDHQLVAEHNVAMDPAYVHITKASMAERARVAALLAGHGVHSIGRYGGWTYCSIEDNIVEAQALVQSW
jgi:protoporphyrinogen oxidase